MIETTLKEYLVNFLNSVEQKYNTKPIAIYISEEYSKQLYKWQNETSLDQFLSTITYDRKNFYHCFNGVIWFNNGDYANTYERDVEITNWTYVTVPKLEDYFILQ